ncbi:E3 ubiquitin-protein ligase RNF144B, partial [Mucuna pruriens]
MGNNLCVTVKTIRKGSTKESSTSPTLNLDTIVENYVPPHHIKPAPVYTCTICCDSRPVYDTFSPEGCNHYYCTKCTLKYIVSKLQSNELKPGCPEAGCTGRLGPEFCKPMLPPFVLGWWERALCEAVIPDKDKLYCPFKDCSTLLSNDASNGTVTRASCCPHCKRNICVQCRAPWHAEISCDKFQKLRDKNDDLMLDLAKRRKWRRCPNCKHYVEKKQGCDDMLCSHGLTFQVRL